MHLAAIYHEIQSQLAAIDHVIQFHLAAINHTLSHIGHIVAINIPIRYYPTAATKCEVSRVRAMLLMGVAYIFLLLLYLPLNSITNTKTVMWNVFDD